MTKSEPQQNGVSHTIFAAGDSDSFRNVAAPFAEALEESIPRHVGDTPGPLKQRMNRGAVNGLPLNRIQGMSLAEIESLVKSHENGEEVSEEEG